MQNQMRVESQRNMRTGRAARWAQVALLYAGQALLAVLAVALFVDVVLIVTPALLGGRWPDRAPVVVAVVIPVVMLACAFLTALPDAMRAAVGRASTDLTDAGREMATSYTGCILLVTGLSLIALVASLPVLLVRLLLDVLS